MINDDPPQAVAHETDGWLEGPKQVTLERIEQERREIARMKREGDTILALFREESLFGHILTACDLGYMKGDIAKLCAGPSPRVTAADFRILP